MAVTVQCRETRNRTESGLSADFTLSFFSRLAQVARQPAEMPEVDACLLPMMNTPSRIALRALALSLAAMLPVALRAADHGAASAAHDIVEKADKPASATAESGKADKLDKGEKGDKPSLRTPRSSLAPSSPARTRAAPESPPEAASGVSMSELRDLIDQKIAEVRAKQEAAPVVRVNNGVAPARKAPARKKPAPAPQEGNSAMAAALAQAHRGESGGEAHWGYAGAEGPDQWARLKPEFGLCATGKRQSPIDIRDGIKVQLEPIQFDYHPSAFRVLDNGHTVQVNVEPGNSITVNGRRYELLQFHFHRPSEERINGRQYEMEAHFVHKDMDGHLAVVAVLMEQGKDHPMVQLVWNSLPLEKHTDQASPVPIDLNMMLPEQRQYLTYMGSLTTPPCTEGVLWMVMKQPAAISRDQIGIFSRLYPMNARPVQPASGRLVKDGQ